MVTATILAYALDAPTWGLRVTQLSSKQPTVLGSVATIVQIGLVVDSITASQFPVQSGPGQSADTIRGWEVGDRRCTRQRLVAAPVGHPRVQRRASTQTGPSLVAEGLELGLESGGGAGLARPVDFDSAGADDSEVDAVS